MRFQFQGREVSWGRRTERRNSDITALAIAQIQAMASMEGSRDTAGREMASGFLSRALAGAQVEGPEFIRSAISPSVLGQIGRDLIQSGASMHVIDVTDEGVVRLFPASSWTFTGTFDPSSWFIEADLAGPSRTTTKRIHYDGVIHCLWGQAPGSPYAGRGPLEWSKLTAKLNAEAERSLGDEASGPVGHLIPVPESASGVDAEGEAVDDPIAGLKRDIRRAKGSAIMLETTADAWGSGRAVAPRKDWIPSRLGPHPPAAWVQARKDAQEAILGACGMSPAVFSAAAPGTAQREGLRRTFLNTVLPIARLVEVELSRKLEAPISLNFDLWAGDLIGRASAFSKLVSGGMEIGEAARISGVLGAAESESN